MSRAHVPHFGARSLDFLVLAQEKCYPLEFLTGRHLALSVTSEEWEDYENVVFL